MRAPFDEPFAEPAPILMLRGLAAPQSDRVSHNLPELAGRLAPCQSAAGDPQNGM